MSDCTYTETQLAALEDSIAKGIFKVKYDDKEITYRSLKEMFQLREHMRQCLGKSPKGGRILISTKKGIC